jgi:pullulanase
MYENFGGIVDQTAKTVTFKLFLPNGEIAPFQYEGGGLPRITNVFVVGNFQSPAPVSWDAESAIPMLGTDFTDSKLVKGTLYSYTSAKLGDGFYEYKYIIQFENGRQRLISDPCGRYGGTKDQNSGFVVGGAVIENVDPLLGPRLPYEDLIVYELMIDDFTATIKSPTEAPLETIVGRLDYLVSLGINAIEFMPWTAWTYADVPKSDFSWGYNPIQYFSVAHKYTLNSGTDLDKLVYLKRLINECHKRNIHVIMDGVFNHADAIRPDKDHPYYRGFPYYWLYEDPADSPYVGNFAQAAFFKDLDYANQCTLEYVRDACFYWMDTFKIDGIRFDNTLGFYRPGDRGHGLPKLLSELRAHISATKNKHFAMVLEHEWDYSSIDIVNKVGATSCWLDKYRSQTMGYLGNGQIESPIMRLLDSGRDFDPRRTPTIYIENHDHLRFMRKAGDISKWYLTQPYVIALFTSPGATLIYNGQEFGMADDMPESGDGRVVPRPLNWDLPSTAEGSSVLNLYKTFIGLRKSHPGLHSSGFYPSGWIESNTQRDPQGFGIDRANNVVVYHRYGDDGSGNKTERFYIVLNFSSSTQHASFQVPPLGTWTELISGTSVTPTDGVLNVDVGSNWGAIYYRVDNNPPAAP